MSRSRVFASVNLHKNKEYWDYDSYMVEWGNLERYEMVRKVGRGKYSDVFHGIDTEINKDVVIKVLKPVKKKKIRRETKILKNLKGGVNVIELFDAVYEPLSRTPALIFEYVDNINFRTLYPTLTDRDIRYYLYQLLRGLHFCHSKGIMHRDIKPHNIVIDHAKRKLRIIDWGLAEFYHAYQEYNVRVASRHYKGPELLVDFMNYDYSLDMWSVGCVLASMCFKLDPFFHGKDNFDQLIKIIEVLGKDDLFVYLRRYRLSLPSPVAAKLKPGEIPKKKWSEFTTPENNQFVNDDMCDLLDNLLRYNHLERLTAKEAMEHRYFDILTKEEKEFNAE